MILLSMSSIAAINIGNVSCIDNIGLDIG